MMLHTEYGHFTQVLRIVGKLYFSDQFIKTIVIKRLDITWMSFDSMHAWF